MKRVATRTGAVTILKKAEKSRELVLLVNDIMDVDEVFEEEKDKIIIFSVRNNP